ncbi:glutamine synthetase family protein, partial [uncultured Clostridium sp.]|uniref:glutamine synthetase family protein n=1 Tax=uncultured Clostridium sp. TaxID=59620 RepID=UPI0025F7FDDF
MMSYTKEDILKIVEENDINFIRLQFTDIVGNLKNVAITKGQLEKALDNKCTLDGSSIDGFARIEESDMYLRPDLDSFVILPWRPDKNAVARMICDVYVPSGEAFLGDPRQILKKAIEKAEEMGYELQVGPECEFFLFHRDEVGRAIPLTHDEAGYFDLDHIDLGGNVRRQICLNLEKMGFKIEASHHEVAHGQHEIDFKYDEALKTADNIMTFKMTVQAIAKNMGLAATFMPKPKTFQNGSGMHTNMSLFKDGVNIFYDRNDGNGLSEIAYNFIA